MPFYGLSAQTGTFPKRAQELQLCQRDTRPPEPRVHEGAAPAGPPGTGLPSFLRPTPSLPLTTAAPPLEGVAPNNRPDCHQDPSGPGIYRAVEKVLAGSCGTRKPSALPEPAASRVGIGMGAAVRPQRAGQRKLRGLSRPGVLETHHDGDIDGDNLSSGPPRPHR